MSITIDYRKFNPQFKQGGYSKRDALSLALASHLAYAHKNDKIDSAKIAKTAGAWGFNDVETFEAIRGMDIDTQGFLAANNSHLLIAFRGSDSKADWLTNFQALYDPGPLQNSKVHEGFQDAFFPAVLQIGRTLERFRTNNQQIWVAGHSLGGALAVLLVAVLLRDGIDVAGLYTYGAPRLGNSGFAKAFDKKMKGVSFRVVNSGDVVPHVPMEMRFSHTGNRILFDQNGKRKTGKGAWKGYKTLIWGWIGGLGGGKIVIKDAHLLASNIGYIKRLQNDL